MNKIDKKYWNLKNPRHRSCMLIAYIKCRQDVQDLAFFLRSVLIKHISYKCCLKRPLWNEVVFQRGKLIFKKRLLSA